MTARLYTVTEWNYTTERYTVNSKIVIFLIYDKTIFPTVVLIRTVQLALLIFLQYGSLAHMR